MHTHTQNTQTERINAAITENVNARKAEYYVLPGNELDTSPSSSDGQNHSRNLIHIDDYFNSIRDLQNESILREMEAERRSQDTIEHNTMMYK